MDLKHYYDRSFAEAAGGQIYGSCDDWTPIQRSGHFARRAILDGLELGDLSHAAAMDYGMGAWGFASVFPRLHQAARCIGVDISSVAVELSRERDAGRLKADYHTSDGRIPVPDDSLDVFWAGEVIEHVVEPRRFLQDAARACREGAHVILSTPNRDALPYLVAGEDYAIGPEHIALLNHRELVELAGLFMRDVRVYGYETSLGPGQDDCHLDEETLAAVQSRAYGHARLATGMVLHGIVDKARKSDRRWRESVAAWSTAQFSAEPQVMSLCGPETGAALGPDSTATVLLAGRKYVTFLWAHDWSGNVEVAAGGQSRRVDLYSRQAGFRRVELELPTSEVRPLTVRRLGSRAEPSRDSQVILHSVVALDW